MLKNEFTSKMTIELASYIKDMRIDKLNASYRRIATLVSEKYPKLGVLPSNQIDGMDLCQAAKNYLKDKSEGW